jgi:hypothetical protein
VSSDTTELASVCDSVWSPSLRPLCDDAVSSRGLGEEHVEEVTEETLEWAHIRLTPLPSRLPSSPPCGFDRFDRDEPTRCQSRERHREFPT